MIKLIPSMSVYGGKSVRLPGGRYEDIEVHKESPLAIAKHFEDHGVKSLHLVDLDGAKTGSVVNFDTLKSITDYTKLYVDFGGGIRTDGDVAKCFEFGAKALHIGMFAVNKAKSFNSWMISYSPTKLILSVNTIDEMVMDSGKGKSTGLNMYDHIRSFYDKSLLYAKCADISRNSILEGPNFEMYAKLVKEFPNLRIYASGGVSSMDDVKRLQDMGIYGVMLGQALYQETITLKEVDAFMAKA